MSSPQTLTEADRRIVAAWAARCAEHVLPLFEAQNPADDRPRDAIARARAFSRGELDAAGEIRRRFVAGRAARDATTPAAISAARSAAQAAGVAHMGAHALGAAAYAAQAAGYAAADGSDASDGSDRYAAADASHAIADEIRWQLQIMTPEVRAALRHLPPVGQNAAGPLGNGLLASGTLGAIIRDLQSHLNDQPDTDSGGPRA